MLGIVCFAIGAFLLLSINWMVFAIALLTLVTYVWIYTPLKQVSWINTLVGAVPGALPLLGGWAASGTPFHLAGISLMFTLFCWQIPHFYALSIMYLEDYKRANFKMLPIEDNEFLATKRQIIIFSILMILASVYPFFVYFLSEVYFFGVVLISSMFLVGVIQAIKDLSKKNAKKLFILSIIYLPMWFLFILLDIYISLN